MDAKEELKNILLWEAKIDGKLEQIKRLEAQAMKVTSAMGGESVSRTRDNDPHGRYMVQRERLEKAIVALQMENERRKRFFARIIDDLRNPMHIRVLYGLYFNGKKPATIAEEIKYCYRQVLNFRDDALAEVQKIVENQNVSFIS